MGVALASACTGCLLALATACSAGSSSPQTLPATSTGTSTAGGSPTARATTAPATTALGTESSPYGTILTTGNGHTLYALSTDSSSRSTCAGGCTSTWAPLRASGAIVPGPGVRRDLVDLLRRSDGIVQLTYGGHPLYTFRGDAEAGQINGHASRTNGGIWLVVSAGTGQPVSTPPGGSSPGAVHG